MAAGAPLAVDAVAVVEEEAGEVDGPNAGAAHGALVLLLPPPTAAGVVVDAGTLLAARGGATGAVLLLPMTSICRLQSGQCALLRPHSLMQIS